MNTTTPAIERVIAAARGLVATDSQYTLAVLRAALAALDAAPPAAPAMPVCPYCHHSAMVEKSAVDPYYFCHECQDAFIPSQEPTDAEVDELAKQMFETPECKWTWSEATDERNGTIIVVYFRSCARYALRRERHLTPPSPSTGGQP